MWKQRLAFLCVAMLVFLGITGKNDTAVSADAAEDIPVETKYVAITFDDGPRRWTTSRLLDGLQERGASATFFLVGELIEENRDLVERMQAEGHQVGNHTWSHVLLKDASDATLLQEVGDTDLLLREILGNGDYWLRPPYGLIKDSQKKLITKPMIHWSVDPVDWEVLDSKKVVQSVLEQVEPGDIILLHDFYPTSVDAALEIIDTLQEQGYLFVTVEELLALNGIEATPGKMIRSGRPVA